MTPLGHLPADERGAAYVEFLMAFVPILLLVLGVVQFTLTATAQLVVAHAARTGVRAAIVVLDDDPAFYDEAVGVLRLDDDADDAGWQGRLLDALGAGSPAQSDVPRRRGGARLSAIRRAVSRPMSVLAPGLGELWSRTSGVADVPLADTFSGVSRIAIGLGLYSDWTAAVTFPQAPGSSTLYAEAVPSDAEEITLRVTYLHRCTVPIVAALMCDSLPVPAAGGANAAQGQVDGLGELQHVPSPLGLRRLLEAGGYHRVLTAEATLPRQSAAYSYASAGQ